MQEADQKSRLEDAVMIYGGLNFCEICNREAFPETHLFNDQTYGLIANTLFAAGWTADDAHNVYCQECSCRRRA
jgi:hypothetical protein